ncbi:ATP-binding cassette domain-containing protein [Fastidiosipila sanguinis]|uniref:ABC transporter ATP-binding protein n=1 Tax=Fastidiosipila sanguinis TaxID=236753 RepID=A0A2S0KLH9_9FIRM|nr:ABC transporter ATP-binding protein [Fastidiosipila sanguinis]AVM41859.1 ABC transporter ATP-binding protein [Fastidiosipila sanguinis]
MLKINNLNKDFNGFKVLIDLNWELPSGNIVGLIGSNGAGKSTLLRCISNVYNYNEGEILFNDVSTKIDRSELFFVSDEPFYFNRFNTRDMKDFYKSFYKNFDEEKYQELLKKFSFDELKPINELSKGLKRQSAIILGLSTCPKLLLMDESFDGLDPKMRLTLKRELIHLVEEEDVLVIISSHNIRELEDICDSMALLENNQIVFDQTLEELNNNYHKVQLGYKEAPAAGVFDNIPLLYLEQNNKVVTVIYHGEEAEEQLKGTNPILLNPLSVSMEEIFVAEMENKHSGSDRSSELGSSSKAEA